MRLNLRSRWDALSENRRKVLRNVAWAMLGKAVSMVGVLFVGILVGRYLGPEKYGLMNYVISFVTLFVILAEFGLGNIEIRELAKEPESRNGIMGTCFALRVAFAALAYILLWIIVAATEDDASAFSLIRSTLRATISLPSFKTNMLSNRKLPGRFSAP